MGADVLNIEALARGIEDVHAASGEMEERVSRELRESQRVMEETREEEQRSSAMLETAKGIEAATHAWLLVKEAELAAALAEEASAFASGNPILIMAASAKVAEAICACNEAREKYEAAKAHRERLEHRYDLAVRCVNIATRMVETEEYTFRFAEADFKRVAEEGVRRLSAAKSDLEKYVSRTAPQVREAMARWEKWKPRENQPIKPKEVHDRLNVDHAVLEGVIAYLYATDSNFRNQVNGYRAEGMNPVVRRDVERKIRKNMSGRLSEELAIRAFGPMGERVETQGRTYLEDGSYTKTDLIVRKLKVPLILGRGEGMGAREGSDFAVEVKSGKKEYLYDQISHMKKQAMGHKACALSCTVCTRDIKDLPPEKEQALRSAMEEVGSPLLGMLPRKEEIDQACFNFVFGDENCV